METSAGLQTLVEGSGAQLENKLCVLNEAWGQVRTLTEDWLSAVLVSVFHSKVQLFMFCLYLLMRTLSEFLANVYRATRTK